MSQLIGWMTFVCFAGGGLLCVRHEQQPHQCHTLIHLLCCSSSFAAQALSLAACSPHQRRFNSSSCLRHLGSVRKGEGEGPKAQQA